MGEQVRREREEMKESVSNREASVLHWEEE